jgi:hypothetical protein
MKCNTIRNGGIQVAYSIYDQNKIEIFETISIVKRVVRRVRNL